MIVFGLNMLAQHDASACLVVDGRIVAYGEEERFSRRKKAARELPEAAARYCLRATGVRLDQVDAIALPFAVYGTPFHDEPPDPRNTFGVREGRVRDDRRLTQFLRGLAPGSTLPDRVFYVAHHLAHAASAYRLSGLDQTAVLVADAEGDQSPPRSRWVAAVS